MPFWKRQRPKSIVREHDARNIQNVDSDHIARLSPNLDHPVDAIEAAQYGIFMFQDKPADASKVIDIVAVHGLNGHYQNTWTETTANGEVNWLRDFLPKQMPNARIMSYSYNSAVEFSKAAAGIKTFAEQLLEDLMARRVTQRERERPIIFICHSLGGIVFKQALIRAHERDRFANLLIHIRGVVFFGTPHKGADLADWGYILANMIKVASLGTRTNAKLLDELRSRSEILQDISKSFVDRGRDLVIFSFYETDKMEYLNCKVVPEQSAVLNLPNETSIAMNGNHRSMCRFTHVNEERYRRVWVNLQMIAATETRKTLSEEEKSCFSKLYTSDYESHKSRIPSPTTGTCTWILSHRKYRHWEEGQYSNLLWISADPGCGKSVLMKFLIKTQATRETARPKNICYFFFKDDNDEQRSSTHALSALLHQIYTFQPELLNYALPQFARKGSAVVKQWDTLWAIFKATVEDPEANDTICFIDGLDECDASSRSKIMLSLANYFKPGQAHLSNGPSLKIIIASRPDNSIKAAFQNIPGIRLRGEDETAAISHDVELVVRENIGEMKASGLPKELLADLQAELIRGADRTFLWTTLTINLLMEASERGASKKELDEILHSRDIDEIYARLLEGSASTSQAKKMLQIVIAAARPLALDEMNIALAIPPENAARTHPITTREERLAFQHPPKIKSLDVLDSHLKLSFENYVKSLCGHFLRVIDQRIYLVHQTAREYLLGSDPVVQPRPNWLIAPIVSFSEEQNELEKKADDGQWPRKIQNAGPVSQPEPLLQPGWTDIKKGTLQHSLTKSESIRILLDICVSYIYLFDTERQYPEDAPIRNFLGYAANYWTIHFEELNETGELDATNPRYLFLVNPAFGGFQMWTSAHTSYRLNFPGRMHIPGAAAASDHLRELQVFFGLEEPDPSIEKLKANKAFGMSDSLKINAQNLDENDGVQGHSDGSDEDKMDEYQIPDRIKRYQHLQSWERQYLESSRSMSHPARESLFPVKDGKLFLTAASTGNQLNNSEATAKSRRGHKDMKNTA